MAALVPTPPAIMQVFAGAHSRYTLRPDRALGCPKRRAFAATAPRPPRLGKLPTITPEPDHGRRKPVRFVARVSRDVSGEALGVSAPKRLRWALCGGHGRHGAG